MSDRGLRNIEQIQEDEGGRGSQLGTLLLASLGGACVVFAAVALLRKPPQAVGKMTDPLDALVVKAAASAAPGRDITSQDVTFPGLLSDEARPTTALAALPRGRGAASAVPFEVPPGAPTVPPPPGDRLPVMPLPAQRVLSATPVVTNPRDSLTIQARDASTVTGPLADEGHPGPFLLQVSSFKKENEARDFSTVLRQRGHHAYVESANLPTHGGVWWRVRVGPFKTSREANVYRGDFERKEHIVPFLVEPEKEKKLVEGREAERRVRESSRRRSR
jgi:DedD protein